MVEHLRGDTPAVISRRRATDIEATAWKDARITFTLPAQRHDGTPWTPGQRITIGVIVGGQESINALPFTIQP
jgi:hypothetical protein